MLIYQRVSRIHDFHDNHRRHAQWFCRPAEFMQKSEDLTRSAIKMAPVVSVPQ